jgi:hypothetical protein
MGQIKQMMGVIRSAQNPTAMLNQMIMQNPNLKQVMDIVNQYGGDANKAFYAIAEQKGINPQEIIDMLK